MRPVERPDGWHIEMLGPKGEVVAEEAVSYPSREACEKQIAAVIKIIQGAPWTTTTDGDGESVVKLKAFH